MQRIGHYDYAVEERVVVSLYDCKASIRRIFLDGPSFCMRCGLYFLALGGVQENSVLIRNNHVFLGE